MRLFLIILMVSLYCTPSYAERGSGREPAKVPQSTQNK